MLTSLALIFLCGLLMGSLFKKLKLPRLIGMLITGIVLGPYVLNILDPGILSISGDLRQIALIIILARAGFSLEIDDLKAIGRPAVLMCFVPACFEMLATTILAPKLLHLPLLDSAILAAVIASASPAVIVPRMLMLMEKGYGTDKNIPQLILAGDSVDDIFNIVVFTSLLGLTGGGEISPLRFASIPVSILSGAILGIFTGIALNFIFKKIHMRDSIKILIILSLGFLLVSGEDLLQDIFPFSGLLSVMAAGVIILKKSPVTAKRISGKLSKLWVAAEVILFVLVGASVDIRYISYTGLSAVLMLILALMVRGFGILLCLVKTRLSWKERIFCTFTGIPKATVQAAIGGIPLAMGLENGAAILAAAVISILFTAPLGAIVLDKSYKHLLSHKINKN